MNHTTRCLVMTSILAMAACGEQAEPTFELRDGQADAPKRPPGGGAFINNGLHDPQIAGIDPAHALTTLEGMDGARLDHPDRLATASYLVECALPLGVSITKEVAGVPTEMHGSLGLAPEWEDEACDEDCQEWVSACLLARTNVSGQEVQLWLKGDHPALGTGTNLSYPFYEASFFGNLFADPNAHYMCLGRVVGPVFAQLEGRTCSNVVGGYCDITPYSLCELTQRCTFQGLVSPTAKNCRAGSPASGPGLRTITTYVQDPLL